MKQNSETLVPNPFQITRHRQKNKDFWGGIAVILNVPQKIRLLSSQIVKLILQRNYVTQYKSHHIA